MKSRSALLFYMLTSVILFHTRGTYHPVLVVLLATASTGLIWILMRNANETTRSSTASLPVQITTVVVFFSYLLWNQLPLEFARETPQLMVVKFLHSCALGCALLVWVIEYLQLNFDDTARIFAGGALMIFALGRFLLPVVSPVVPIDVLVLNNLACDHLAAGCNPYASEYPDIYEGKGSPPGCPYGPAMYLWSTPFRYLLGDVRYANAAAECLTAVFLIALARQARLPVRVSMYIGLAWLANPVGIYVLERAWIDPLLTTGMVASTLFLLRQQWVALGIALGFVASVKQYGFPIPVFVILWLMRHDYPWKRVAAVTVATSLAFVAPFVLADPHAFYRNTMQAFFSLDLRTDALSLQVLYAKWAGRPCPQWIPQSISLAALVLTAIWITRQRDRSPTAWLAALIAFYMSLFLFGKVAFCNYYHFVASIALTYFVVSLSTESWSGFEHDGLVDNRDFLPNETGWDPIEQESLEMATS